MIGGIAYAPGPRSEFVELARTAKGRLFRKQILHVGDSFVHPNDPNHKIMVDRQFADKMLANFTAGMCDIVQVPIVDSANKHVEDPLRNLGEVVDVEVDDKGVYAIIDARKQEYADELGKTLLGASAMLHLNYADTRTGEKVGPTLLHVAVTNRPYITNLNDFEEMVAASAESMGEKPVLLAGERENVDLEELLAILKDEHGIDVEALQAQVSEAGEAPEADPSVTAEASDPADPVEVQDDAPAQIAASATLIEQINEVLGDSGMVTLSAEDGIDPQVILDTLTELNEDRVSLSQTVVAQEEELETLRLTAAETRVDGLVEECKILPSQKDAMLKLSMSDPETFEALIPAEPILKLGAEGVAVVDEPDSATRDDMADEVQRYLAEQADQKK